MQPRRAGLWITGALLLAAVSAVISGQEATSPAPEESDLFSEVFGTGGEEELALPLVLNDEFLGEVTARVAPQRVLVDGPAVVAAVSERLNDDARDTLTELTGNDQFIDIAEFTPLGLFLVYQQEQVRLTLQLAPDVMSERLVGPGGERQLLNVQEPVALSGYLNLRGRTVVISEGEPELIQAEFEPVVNYRGWVLESLIGASSDETEPVTLRHSRLVRDLPTSQIRAEGGIVRYDTGALFGAPELIGLSGTRREEIGYGPPLYRDGDTRFVVPVDGVVEIYLNDRIYQHYRLPPGPHRATGLPFGQGSNNLRIVGAGPAEGERTVIMDRRVFYSPRLVARGRHVYSGAVGAVREMELPDGLFTSVLYRYGLGEYVTLGTATQFSPSEYALGGGALAATPIGVSRLDVAGFASDGGEIGGAVELGHTISLLYAPRVPKIEIQGRYRSAEYRTVLGAPSSGSSLRAALVLNQRIGGGANASLTAARTWALSGAAGNETAVRIGGNFRSAQGYSLSAQIGPTMYADGTVVWQGSVFVRISTDDRGISTSANYDLGRGPGTLQVANAPREPYRSVSWNATTQGFDQTPGSVEYVEGTVGYAGYRGTVQLQPRLQRTVSAEGSVAGVTGRYATAIVWAGGRPLVSRPVQNGFVVLVPREHIAPYQVPVRPGGGAVSAVVENNGAVLPDLPAWSTTTVTLDGAELPDGFFPGDSPVSFRSAYRTGYRVIVGSTATVYVTGRLVDGEDDPIGLQAGEIIDPFGNSTLFFTDRGGAFEIVDIAPGEYRLYLFSNPGAQSIFAVPEGEAGEYELGDVLFLTEEN